MKLVTRVGALALYPNTKKCFFHLGQKSRFVCLSFIDFIFNQNVIFELRYCKFSHFISVAESGS